jgi:hypothetical protein
MFSIIKDIKRVLNVFSIYLYKKIQFINCIIVYFLTFVLIFENEII